MFRRKPKTEETRKDKVELGAAPVRKSWIWSIVYADPAAIVTGIWDAFDAWRVTRNWRALIWFTPAFCVLVLCFGTILWGMTRSKADLRDRYLQLAEKEAPILVQAADARPKTADTDNASNVVEVTPKKPGVQFSEYADLLYRRVLQLESNNVRARYYVAYRVGASGNVVQARSMMQELAPDKAKGFEPAHAWVATDMIQRFGRGELDERAKDALIHHLEIASTWEQADINLLLIYSGILESQGRVDEAIKVCRQAANRDSTLHLAVAEICNRAKYNSQANDEATAAIKVLKVNFGTDLEKETDRVGVARAHLIRNEPDEAVKILAEGLQFNADRPMVKRMLSEVLRLKYRASFRQTASGIELNMNLLEAAANVDPGNPSVGEEIAQLSQMGVAASENTIETLKKQLANGTASAITHTLLGNAYASRSLWPKAISHWELALGQNPNLVLVLNNLAVAMAQQDPKNVTRSLEMIDKALAIVGGSDAELFDSRGQVLLAAGQPKEAISWFEKSLGLDTNRVATREGMIKAAEQAGIPDLVEIHTNALAQLKERLANEAEEKKDAAPSEAPKSAKEESPKESSPVSPVTDTKSSADGNGPATADTPQTSPPK